MAVAIQTLNSGSKNLVVLLSIAAANADAVVVDVAATDPKLTLVEAQWSLTGAAATLEWDATTDDLLLECSVGYGFMLWNDGVPNPFSAGATGDVLLTNAAGLTSGSIYLKFKKN